MSAMLQNNFVGARPYEEKDKEIFFGRENEVEELFQLVKINTFTLLYGRSGLGKTSVLQAGLFPKLKNNNYLPVYLRPDYNNKHADFVKDVEKKVTGALESKGYIDLQRQNNETLWEYFHRLFTGKEKMPPLRLVLIFDQFEEIFTLGSEDKSSQLRTNSLNLVQFISELIENNPPSFLNENMRIELQYKYGSSPLPVKLLFSFREEYLGDFYNLSRQIPSVAYSNLQFKLLPLTYQKGYDVIKNASAGLFEEQAIKRTLLAISGAPTEAEAEKSDIDSFLLSLFCENQVENLAVEKRSKITYSDILNADIQNIVYNKYKILIKEIELNESEINLLEKSLLSPEGFKVPFPRDQALHLTSETRVREEKINALQQKKVIKEYTLDGRRVIEIIHDRYAAAIKFDRDYKEQQIISLKQAHEQNRTTSTFRLSLLTIQELRLRDYLNFLSVFYFCWFLLHWANFFMGTPVAEDDTLVISALSADNAGMKMLLYVVLCYVAAADVRRFLFAVEVIIVVLAVAAITGFISLVMKRNENYGFVFGMEVSEKSLIIGNIITDVILGVLLTIFYRSAQKARHSLSFLNPSQFRSLTAIADVATNSESGIMTPGHVAYNVDRYLASFRSDKKWLIRMALSTLEFYPVLYLKPPLSYMRPEERKSFLMKHFYGHFSVLILPSPLLIMLSAAIRTAKQLTYIGYYSDPRVYRSIGYVPFSQRINTHERLAKFPPKHVKELFVLKENDIPNNSVKADVVIIGTGPAAAIMAKGLVEKGRSVLLLERGEYKITPAFTEDEIDMVSSLYANGALQLVTNAQLPVLQGNGVGGSGEISNAVCFDTPENVLDRWNDKQGFDAGIDIQRYMHCMKKVNTVIRVKRVPELTISDYLNPGGKLFIEGCKKLGLDNPPNIMDAVAANIEGCVGSGYCNIGCMFGKKLSVRDTILPETQQKYGTSALSIITGCEVLKLKAFGGNIKSVVCKFGNGKDIEVKANTFVVAAGAVASSRILQRSGIAEGKAGRFVSFNISSSIHAVFPQQVNAYDGLPVSHYLLPKPDRGFIFETQFNTPMLQSLVMPGWWDDHFKNMLRYDRLACTSVLVGTESNAQIKPAGLTGNEIKYKPTKKDLNTLLDGLLLGSNIFLAAGAEVIIPNTTIYMECKTADELNFLSTVVNQGKELNLLTKHPQGGNPISASKSRGVVDSELKVYGFNNLYVCDASVFPGSVGVHPQITVMSLAEYAVDFVA